MSGKRTHKFDSVAALVVDDHGPMRLILKTLLNGFGIKTIYEATDGAAAFDVLRESQPDVVFADFAMKPLDGLDFVRLVRRAPDSPNPYVPIIMVSGHTDRRRVIEARDSGIDEYLAKPFSARALADRIDAVINNRRQFVKSPGYVGPDRRRKTDPRFMGPWRRAGDKNG